MFPFSFVNNLLLFLIIKNKFTIFGIGKCCGLNKRLSRDVRCRHGLHRFATIPLGRNVTRRLLTCFSSSSSSSSELELWGDSSLLPKSSSSSSSSSSVLWSSSCSKGKGMTQTHDVFLNMQRVWVCLKQRDSHPLTACSGSAGGTQRPQDGLVHRWELNEERRGRICRLHRWLIYWLTDRQLMDAGHLLIRHSWLASR